MVIHSYDELIEKNKITEDEMSNINLIGGTIEKMWKKRGGELKKCSAYILAVFNIMFELIEDSKNGR